MRRIAMVLTLALLSATSARVQEHAPTVDVCRADRALWYPYSSPPQTDDGAILKLSFDQVHARQGEMGNCARVDAENKQDWYLNAAEFYATVMSIRTWHFISRHNLEAQFFQEDAAGKR